MLFPKAMAGKKVVVCMRAAEHWGLVPGTRYDKALFAPLTVRGGYMRKTGSEDASPEAIIDAVRAAIAKPG